MPNTLFPAPFPQSDFETQYCCACGASLCVCNADTFAREQKILDHALARLEMICEKSPLISHEYAALVTEYGQLLQQARGMISLTGSMNKRIHDLRNLILQDPLTGIRNRRYLEDNLERIVKTLQRGGGELGVLMVDVDLFKQYNDIYGHSMGDIALKKVAAALKQSLTRTDDFVVRYGGEEFAVILPNTDAPGVRIMAERVLAKVRDCNIPYEHSDISTRVTVSVGATSGKVTLARCGSDFIKLADEALYNAKHSGRDSSIFRGFE